jgi:hypothetical protein
MQKLDDTNAFNLLQFPNQLLLSKRAICSKKERIAPKSFDIWIPVYFPRLAPCFDGLSKSKGTHFPNVSSARFEAWQNLKTHLFLVLVSRTDM